MNLVSKKKKKNCRKSQLLMLRDLSTKYVIYSTESNLGVPGNFFFFLLYFPFHQTDAN